jgi:hypothetical protein
MEQMADVPALQTGQHRNHHLHHQMTQSQMRYNTYHSSVSHSQGKSNFKKSCSKDTTQRLNQNGEKIHEIKKCG